MTQRCEVLVVGGTDAAVALAQTLRAYQIDVRLAGVQTTIDALGPGPDAITVSLRDATDRVEASAAFLVTEGERPERDGRRLTIGDAADAENLGWKLASVVRGAADMLLDTYVTERAERPNDYRMSPLSQRFGGKRVRIPPGQRIPDDLVLWSPTESREVRLWPSRRWTVLGFGSDSAATVHAVIERFGDQVNAQVIGGGNSQSGLVTLIDRYGHVNRRLAKRGGSVLAIRPDQYVGLHTAPDLQIVLAYLEDLIPATRAASADGAGTGTEEPGSGPEQSGPEGTALASESFSS